MKHKMLYTKQTKKIIEYVMLNLQLKKMTPQFSEHSIPRPKKALGWPILHSNEK